MSNIAIPYQFQNQTIADANQVDQNFSAITTVVNGNLDDTNVKVGSLSASIATEGVKTTQTYGIPYAQDVYGGSFLFNGFTVTKDSTNANQIDVATGIATMKQTDGTLRRFNIAATNFKTVSASATYYLDLNPDGTYSWATGHSSQANYLNVATVTSDASSNVLTITQNTNSYQFTPFGNATQRVVSTMLASARNVLVTSTSAQQILTFTPTTNGMYSLKSYLRVVTASTTVTLTIAYADSGGAQSYTPAALNAQSIAVGSHGVIAYDFEAVSGTAITLTVTAGTANQVYVTGALVGVA